MSCTCSVDGCDGQAHAQGLCPKHYQRMRRNGNASATNHQPTAARFWNKVDTSGDCWVWIGALNENGYGVLHNKSGERLAHRFSYELEHGDGSASGLFILHKCDNPRCVKPAHLFAGTHIDNMTDMRAKGRSSRAPRTPGEAHHNAKLTDAAVKAIRAAHASGLKFKDIAAQHGISVGNAERVVHRRAWRHI